MTRLLIIAASAALLTSASAGAQDIAACRKISDDTARLACFDRASQNPAPAPASSLSSTPTPTPTPTPPSAAFGLDTPAPTKPEDFGRSSLPPSAPVAHADEPAPITSITAKVTRIIDPYGKPKFVLDNNQVWGALTYIQISPRSDDRNTVTIESSLVGYMMRLNESSSEFSVKRLK